MREPCTGLIHGLRTTQKIVSPVLSQCLHLRYTGDLDLMSDTEEGNMDPAPLSTSSPAGVVILSAFRSSGWIH
jgi:hypothetical protein